MGASCMGRAQVRAPLQSRLLNVASRMRLAAVLGWLCLLGCDRPSPSVAETLEMIASYDRRTPAMEVFLTQQSQSSREAPTLSTTCVLEFRRDPIVFRATVQGPGGDEHVYQGDESDLAMVASQPDAAFQESSQVVAAWGLIADPGAISRYEVVDVARSSEGPERRVLRLTSRLGVALALEVSEAPSDRGAIVDVRVERPNGAWVHILVQRATSSSWTPGEIVPAGATGEP